MHLPRDTEVGAMTWSTLVLGLQVIGAFPYTVGKEVQKPKFSIPLLLWFIFQQVFSLTGILVIMKIVHQDIESDVGQQTMFYSFFTLLTCITISPLLLMINNQKIADMVREMGSQEEPMPCPKRKWITNKFSAFLMLLQFCALMFVTLFYAVKNMFNLFELLCVMEVNMFLMFSYFLSLELIDKTYDHFSQRLSKAADDLHRTASSISFVNNAENGSEVFISALHSFQLKVWKVSEY